MLDDYADENDDPIIEWLINQQHEPELDEQRSPPRPASVVAREIRVDPGQWTEKNIPHKVSADQPQSEETQETHSSHNSISDTSSQRFERQIFRQDRQSAIRHPSSQPQKTQSQRSISEGKEKTVAHAPLSRVQELSGSDSKIRKSDDDTSSSSQI